MTRQADRVFFTYEYRWFELPSRIMDRDCREYSSGRNANKAAKYFAKISCQGRVFGVGDYSKIEPNTGRRLYAKDLTGRVITTRDCP
jgi:hypothetical protein